MPWTLMVLPSIRTAVISSSETLTDFISGSGAAAVLISGISNSHAAFPAAFTSTGTPAFVSILISESMVN
jgi:hypothetical protein